MLSIAGEWPDYQLVRSLDQRTLYVIDWRGRWQEVRATGTGWIAIRFWYPPAGPEPCIGFPNYQAGYYPMDKISLDIDDHGWGHGEVPNTDASRPCALVQIQDGRVHLWQTYAIR